MKRPLLYAAYLLSLGAVTYYWYKSAAPLFEGGFAASLLAIGRLAGLLGTVVLLVQFILISRAPWIERIFGFDRLTRIHRTNGVVAFVLITSHIPLVTAGTAGLSGVTVPEQYRTFLFAYDYIWLAVIAYGILVLTILVSIAAARKWLSYQRWYYLHLLNYGIAFLALFHQVNIGTTLNTSTGFLYFWYALYVFVFVNLAVYRFLSPTYNFAKYRFKVDRLEEEASGTYSIYVTGKEIDRFMFEAGQFAKWRFMQKGFWKEEHPFTFSAEANGRYLRLTPKAVGDYTARISNLKPGTPVVVSGPFGRLTLKRAKRRELLFIAGGIGVTPLRAMLATITNHNDAVLVYAARKKTDIAFKNEIDHLAKQKNIKVAYVLSDEKAPGYEYGRLDADKLRNLSPDFNQRDVFLVGPPPMMDALEKMLTDEGVPPGHIYTERYSFV